LPSCNAVLISASLQFPMPLSRSGVMLVAQTSNGGSSKRNPPESASKFRDAPPAPENADEIRVSDGHYVVAVAAKTERKGTKTPGVERRVPEFLPDRSSPVRRDRGGVA
jgi:hypothetical protein